ncbi:MAG: malate synthase G, partial [Rickettsiales bacterium]|nr:malate synthase G [Rickettsiales bacterium]
MRDRVNKYGLQVDKLLFDFVNDKVLPGTDLEVESFWEKSSSIIKKLTKKNRELLSKRLELKQKIDNWNINNKGKELNHDEYKNFLEEIGYLIKEGEKFQINTTNIDEEIASISGPQLVVPITNARYALNAANARWGSLYDALYGTDAMGSLPDAKEYSVERGNKVIKYAKEYLDEIFALKDTSWSSVNYVGIKDNKMLIKTEDGPSELLNSSQYFGCVEFENTDKKEIILEQNKLKIRIIIDKEDRIGGEDIANISDIYMESAISTIMDCEDSVATVDAEDKVLAYDNWLGLMKGNLSTEFTKENNIIRRKLNKDISYTDKNGNKSFLKGRSLMLIRNVGHLMTNPAILDEENNEIHEGLMDAIFTTLIA